MIIKIYNDDKIINEIKTDIGIMIKYSDKVTPRYYSSKKYSEFHINFNLVESFSIVKDESNILNYVNM